MSGGEGEGRFGVGRELLVYGLIKMTCNMTCVVTINSEMVLIETVVFSLE